MSVKEIMFKGPIGQIEGRYHHNDKPTSPIALVLHPHPLRGGTMNSKVTYNLFHSFASNGFSVLRFNFRGVGRSQGVHDDGVGELMDAATALDWIQAHNPNAHLIWVAGFSFGSWIGLQLLMRRPEVTHFVAVSPPANIYDFTFLSSCPVNGLMIQGTDDTIVPENTVFDLYNKVARQRNSDVDYYTINGADHFFRDCLDELSSIVNDYIKPRLNLAPVIKRSKWDRKK